MSRWHLDFFSKADQKGNMLLQRKQEYCSNWHAAWKNIFMDRLRHHPLLKMGAFFRSGWWADPPYKWHLGVGHPLTRHQKCPIKFPRRPSFSYQQPIVCSGEVLPEIPTKEIKERRRKSFKLDFLRVRTVVGKLIVILFFSFLKKIPCFSYTL